MISSQIVSLFQRKFGPSANYATLRGYTLQMTLTDMAWGTFLCGTAAGVTSFTMNKKFL